MNEELVKHQLEVHDKRINNHAERIDKLERDSTELKIELKNLCESLQGLTSIMKWFIALLVGAFVSFFFYVVQQGIFK